MKKLKLITMMLFMMVTTVSFGQTYNEYYFGEDVQLYKNSLLIIDTTSTGNMSYLFYGDLKDCQTPYNDNVLYPTEKYKFSTDKSKLKNRVFIVDNIIDKTGKEFSGKPNRINAPILIIRDTLTNEIIYFKYDSKYATSSYGFPFLTNTTLPTEYFCNKLQVKVDDFNGETTIQNPYTLTTKQMVYKIIKNSDTTYYLRLTSYGSTVNVDGKGVIILFDDGTKFEKPNAKIDVEVGKKDYDYSCFISLTKDEVKLFATKKISKYRLYIYDTTINSFTSESLMNYFTCLLK